MKLVVCQNSHVMFLLHKSFLTCLIEDGIVYTG
jgi:hypothetical protein